MFSSLLSCPYYGTCGGCSVQDMPQATYAAWKRDKVTTALAQAGVQATVGEVIDAHGQGRRRAVFHVKDSLVGFMRTRTHEIIAIDQCPLFAQPLAPAPTIARKIALALQDLGKPLDVQITATRSGLDVDVRGCGALPPPVINRLITLAERCDLARLSNHGVALITRRTPELLFGEISVCPPPGGFLQATEAGERILAQHALAALQGKLRIADLFCGVGPFALRLSTSQHTVYAVDKDQAAIAALRRAAGERLEATARDLFAHPLPAAELARFDAVLLDPPRAGALTQTREIAASGVERVVMIACHVETFARDARCLQNAGYICEQVTPVDQFRYTNHVEIFSVFHRARKPKRRSLLG